MSGKKRNPVDEWWEKATLEACPTLRVLAALHRGEDPTDEDLADALGQHDPPDEVLDYAERRVRGEHRKVGRKRGPRYATSDEIIMLLAYRRELEALRAAGGRVAGGLRKTAYENVADRLGVGWRAVQKAVLDEKKRAADGWGINFEDGGQTGVSVAVIGPPILVEPAPRVKRKRSGRGIIGRKKRS